MEVLQNILSGNGSVEGRESHALITVRSILRAGTRKSNPLWGLCRVVGREGVTLSEVDSRLLKMPYGTTAFMENAAD